MKKDKENEGIREKGAEDEIEGAMITAGLTGGIATGKSTVAYFLKEAGAAIVDADKIAHEVVRQGQPAWRAVVDHFGDTILKPDREIDRRRLGDIVFRSPEEKKVLNSIIHPYVFQEMEAARAAIRNNRPNAVTILDIPLLFETGMDRRLTDIAVIIVVHAPRHIQIQRLMARNGFSRKDALARINAQIDIEEKRKQADMVIDNTGDLKKTRTQTLAIYEHLKCGQL